MSFFESISQASTSIKTDQNDCTIAMEFHPSASEMTDFSAYVEAIKDVVSKHEERGGIVKIVLPEKVTMRRSGYDSDSTGDIKIPTMSTQVIKKQKTGFFKMDISYQFVENTLSDIIQQSERVNPPFKHTAAIEQYFWETLCDRPIKYAQHISGSLTDKKAKHWNLQQLGTLLDVEETEIPGINRPMLYFSNYGSCFGIHKENLDLNSVSYMHFGSGQKIWYGIPPKYEKKFEEFLKKNYPDDYRKCNQFWRHKCHLVHPILIRAAQIPLEKAIQGPHEIMITFGYHFGYSTGFTAGEAVNFGVVSGIEGYKKAKDCTCKLADETPVRINFDRLCRIYQKQSEPKEVALEQVESSKLVDVHAEKLTISDIHAGIARTGIVTIESQLDVNTGKLFCRTSGTAEWKEVLNTKTEPSQINQLENISGVKVNSLDTSCQSLVPYVPNDDIENSEPTVPDSAHPNNAKDAESLNLEYILPNTDLINDGNKRTTSSLNGVSKEPMHNHNSFILEAIKKRIPTIVSSVSDLRYELVEELDLNSADWFTVPDIDMNRGFPLNDPFLSSVSQNEFEADQMVMVEEVQSVVNNIKRKYRETGLSDDLTNEDLLRIMETHQEFAQEDEDNDTLQNSLPNTLQLVTPNSNAQVVPRKKSKNDKCEQDKYHYPDRSSYDIANNALKSKDEQVNGTLKENLLKCYICPHQDTSARGRINHIRTFHVPSELLKCPGCSKGFPNGGPLNRHKRHCQKFISL